MTRVERKAWALLTFPKYPTSGEAKASKLVSSPVIGKPPFLFCSTGARCHSKNITMSLEPGAPRQELRKNTATRGACYCQSAVTISLVPDVCINLRGYLDFYDFPSVTCHSHDYFTEVFFYIVISWVYLVTLNPSLTKTTPKKTILHNKIILGFAYHTLLWHVGS